jgi:hypothetical protein
MTTLQVQLNGRGLRGVCDQIIARAVLDTGSVERAAKVCGVSRSTMHDRVSKWKLSGVVPAKTVAPEAVGDSDAPLLDVRTLPELTEKQISAAATFVNHEMIARRAAAVRCENAMMRHLLAGVLLLLLTVAVPAAETNRPSAAKITGLTLPVAPNVEVVPYDRHGQVTLAWDASPDAATVTSYAVKWGTTAGGSYTNVVKVGNVTNATLTKLPEGQKLYFVVTASTAAGVESVPSNEASATTLVWGRLLPTAWAYQTYGRAGKTNVIEVSTNLASTNWIRLKTFVGKPNTVTNVVWQATNSGSAYFRTRTQ